MLLAVSFTREWAGISETYMKLKLGLNDTFDCPEGKFKGVLERVAEPKKRINKPCASQVRYTFRVRTTESKEYLVARTFCADLSFGSELYSFLDSWLDGKFEPFLDSSGEVDLNLLLGKEANLLIGHWADGSRDKPFVKIAGIFPVGTLLEE
jgi:hypothetical protein